MSSPRMTKQTLLILNELLSDPVVEKYGLEICKEIGYQPGTIYPLLYKFESLGWLKSRWEEIDPVSEGRPPRRYYLLTPEGIELARQALDRLCPTCHGSGIVNSGGPDSRETRVGLLESRGECSEETSFGR